jgi:hypothetical protein
MVGHLPLFRSTITGPSGGYISRSIEAGTMHIHTACSLETGAAPIRSGAHPPSVGSKDSFWNFLLDVVLNLVYAPQLLNGLLCAGFTSATYYKNLCLYGHRCT